MEKKIILPFDMSLRFWSDSVPFDDIGARLGLPVDLLTSKGRPMSGKAPVAGRLAKRHFAQLQPEMLIISIDASGWTAELQR